MLFYILLGLVLLYAAAIFVGAKLRELKKRFDVDPNVFKAMRSKYGKVISDVKSDKRLDNINRINQLFGPYAPSTPGEIHTQLFEHMDFLMDDYLRMQAKERVAVRQLMSHHFLVLLAYQYSAESILEATKQPVWLLRGLAATSIENCQTDFRDSMTVLDDLLWSAENIGIAWREPLALISEYSDDSESPGCGGQWQSTKAYLQARAKSDLWINMP
jgi:hypothetical protein